MNKCKCGKEAGQGRRWCMNCGNNDKLCLVIGCYLAAPPIGGKRFCNHHYVKYNKSPLNYNDFCKTLV